MCVILRAGRRLRSSGKTLARLLPPMLMAILILFPAETRGQETRLPETNTIHWAYAAAFGTGYYRIGDEAEIYVLRFRPLWRKPFSFQNHLSGRTFFFELRFPVTFGVHEFSIDELLNPNFRQISFTPGAMLQIPLHRNWNVQLYGNLGWGSEMTGSGNNAWIYWGGVNSRLAFRLFKTEWALLNGLSSYGYKPNKGEAGDLSALITGLEWNHRMWGLKWGKEAMVLRAHVQYYSYFDHLNFLFRSTSPVSLSWEWEIGISIRKVSKFKFLIFTLERLGVAYRFSPNSSGIRFITSALFR